MKKLAFLFGILIPFLFLKAQNSSRIIFIGDAGHPSAQQTSIITDAASKVLPGKTTVVFLGNNIYPKGMTLDSSAAQKADQQILESEFKPFIDKGATVYFIPGNRDWDNGNPAGLSKVLQQADFLKSQNNPLLKMIPEDGCPGPVEVPLSDSLVMIAIDTEWILFPFDKKNADNDCGQVTTKDVESNLRDLIYKNRNKTILLVTHHPSASYGRHGGRFSLKDNLFPLTNLAAPLYLPLPLAGSLYPIFRNVFPTDQDLENPFYKAMNHGFNKTIDHFPNIIQISSHDNGLQLIRDSLKSHTQIVTGIGEKPAYNQKGKSSLFHSSAPGYVVANYDAPRNIQFKFYGLKGQSIQELYTYQQVYKDFKPRADSLYTNITTDSVQTAVYPPYNKVSDFVRWMTGNNYRAEWAAKVQLPVIRLNELFGGLKPDKLGGGHESTSLRLKDSTGKEYVLRSILKSPDRVIPNRLLSPFTLGVMMQFFSEGHPYSALAVPPIAEAVGVPHAHPVIGVVAPDPTLGTYQSLFAGKVNLLEEREPLPGTDNTSKAEKKLQEDNDNSYDAIGFLKARMLDLLIGDWDRHEDQWRFHDAKPGKGKYYVIVPRDRDMVFSVTQGALFWYIEHFVLVPYVYGFKARLLPETDTYLYKSAFMNAYPASQIPYDLWMKTAREFQKNVTDEVLNQSIATLPKGLSKTGNEKILKDLKARRDQIVDAMDHYYKFSNKIIDIHASDKNEFVAIEGSNNAMHILMRKINKKGELKDTLVNKTYPRSFTKEIRLYLSKGKDSVVVDNPSSTIKLRIIGGKGKKAYNIINSKKQIRVYDHQIEHYFGKVEKLDKTIRKDSLNTAFVPVNLYHTYQPLLNLGYNIDDGLLLGGGIRFEQQRGFRKSPYTALHILNINHAFASNAFNITYKGDWTKVIGNANLVVNADIHAPEGTQNFFGAGNETTLNKAGDYHRFYRARFSLYNLGLALKWSGLKGGSFTIGPAFQYYKYDPADNTGRFITQTSLLHTYDQNIIDKNKAHLGVIADYTLDNRNNKILPTYGTYIHIVAMGFGGLNKYSKNYGQILPEFRFYKNLNAAQTIVIADRVGGAITVGKPAFYQYAFLGSNNGTLEGYLQYRFAGIRSFYNNLEARIALSRFGNKIIQGEIGITGFYDIGRVWVNGEHSDVWHHGVGGGIYFAPAYMWVLQMNIGHSSEGWFPAFSMGFRF